MNYINGVWIAGTGPNFTSYNPADNTIVWQGNAASNEQVHQAVAAAHQANAHWSSLPIDMRKRFLQQFSQQVQQQTKELVELIARETGKPLWEARTEIQAVISKINLSIQAFEERAADKVFLNQGIQNALRFKPHGVTVVLGAFNFPAHLSNGHIVPALLAGNTIVYKPSELAPAVAQAIVACWHQAGLPDGVLNCVQGDGLIGQTLLKSDIQGVFFTGSYAIGKQVHRAFSERPEVILALEMGGNNPLIIDSVDDIPATVYHTLLSAFISAGQRCTCARRIFIPQNSQGDEVLHQLIKASQALKVGAYQDIPEPFMGPVITQRQALHSLEAQNKLERLGGLPLLTMRLLKEESALLSPGIIDMTGAKAPPDEEIFAPFIQVYRYNTFQDAITEANNTRYGLAAALFSNKEENYQLFFQRIRAGLINWNRPTTGASSELPFGGVGCSGNHRPSAYFAADYCSYPIASLEHHAFSLPQQLLPGIQL